jgi:hypothetical protein
MHRPFFALALAACWTSSPPKREEPLVETKPTPAVTPSERRAIVRIDAQPSGKKFQGVWLEFADGARWVIDYRPRELWRGFEDAEVIVTGTCYRPFGQAINSPHFKVEQMKFAAKPVKSVPYFVIGPERLLKGTFVSRGFPAGSKLGGSTRTEFRDDGGTQHAIAGSTDTIPAPGAATIKARSVELNMAHVATTGGPHVWILSIHDADYTPDPKTGPTTIPCP